MNRAGGITRHVLCACLPLLASCGLFDSTSFRVVRTPSLPTAHNSISVFGVYKDGLMSPNYWEEIGPQVSTALAGNASLKPGSCESVYGERLQSEDVDLAGKIEDVTKDDGITPELLADVNQRATGSLIMTLDVFGHPPKPKKHVDRAQQPNQNAGWAGPSKRNQGKTQNRAKGTADEPIAEALIMSARFYSSQSRDLVAELDMRYTGATVTEALDKFAEKLKSLIPDPSCASWTWKPAVGTHPLQ